ncbi:uncharacterized protein LOC124124666 [Haliotis rufescens]|uniref:uncharacterized protein LOC124124666 n=1 Tax=Haliotis rufescens TaxID=6454 RepID=UPI00201F0258|nr:uncharacterized protein LOC124124666 [Haliotis rufescens]
MAVLTVHTEPRKAKYKLCDDASGTLENSGTSYCVVEHRSHQRDATAGRCDGDSRRAKLYIGVAVLFVSLAINIIGVVYFWRAVRRDTGDGPQAEALVSVLHDEGTVCTDCGSLGVQPGTYKSDLHGLYVRLVTGSSYLCCLQNAEGLWRLASVFTNRLYKHKQPGTSEAPVTDEGTGAHLYLDSDALKSDSPSLQWNQDYGYGSAYKGIDIKSDGQNLNITKPGLYHVYSFFTFKTHQPRQHPDNVLHTIRRDNAHLPNLGSTVFLMAKKTLPEVSERFVTSYLSATVRLRQDDHVSVTVSNMSYVYRFPPSNFFGLYYVGE